MNQQALNDLLNHATRRIGDIIEQTEDLIDDEDEKTLFMLGLFARLLAVPASKIVPEDQSPDAEAFMTMTVVLMAILFGGERVAGLDQGKIARRGMALSRKLNAAAGHFLRQGG